MNKPETTKETVIEKARALALTLPESEAKDCINALVEELEVAAKASFTGRVYLAPSGQWAFKYFEIVEMGGGAGFESVGEAREACEEVVWERDDTGWVTVSQ